MPHSTTLITPPDELPVALAQAKAHLRVTHTSEDDLISAYLASATDKVQRWTRRQLMQAEYELALDGFPLGGCVIELDLPPLVSVESVTYIDASGQDVTLDASAYQVDIRSTPGRLRPAAGSLWPLAKPGALASVVVAYTAGYADAERVPQALKMAILLLVAHWYEHREAVALTSVSEMPLAVQSLVGMYTLPEVF